MEEPHRKEQRLVNGKPLFRPFKSVYVWDLLHPTVDQTANPTDPSLLCNTQRTTSEYPAGDGAHVYMGVVRSMPKVPKLHVASKSLLKEMDFAAVQKGRNLATKLRRRKAVLKN
ncbi:hypothetical protein CGMCC3_g17209 [Colletotrichum fructicola]|nr:uncharacterized protein CGMCC3_g17209 [Colletotrichum fructicola]KAE9566632.1 hypothetical protein CGMCC3_g17209 [Colletotrichum fructicola]